jgi:hypothetical protein
MQVGGFIGCQFAIIYFPEIDMLPFLQYFHGSYQVALILVVPSWLFSVGQPPFHPHALPPAVVGVLHPFCQLFVELAEGVFGGVDGCEVAECGLEEEGFVFG